MLFLLGFWQKFRRAKKRLNVRARNAGNLAFPLGDFTRDFAANRSKLALQISEPGLFCIFGYDAQHGVVRNLKLLPGNTVVTELARYQILARDRQFLLVGVAGELDDFHTVGESRSEEHTSELQSQSNLV